MEARVKKEYDRAIGELKGVQLIDNTYDEAQRAFSEIRDIVFRLVKAICEGDDGQLYPRNRTDAPSR